MALTEIEVVQGSTLPSQGGTSFEMYGFDLSTGKMSRISPDRVRDKLLSELYIPCNAQMDITANGGKIELTAKFFQSGILYSTVDHVSTIVIGFNIPFARFSVIFRAANERVIVSDTKNTPVMVMQPVAGEFRFVTGATYLMEALMTDKAIYLKFSILTQLNSGQ